MKTPITFMKFSLVLCFIVSITSFTVSGQWRGISGSGTVISQSRAVSGFDEINVGGAFDLFIEIGPDWSVEVVADDNIIDRIETNTRGKALHIELERGTNIRRYKELKVFVTLPEIRHIRASGASTVVCEDPVRQSVVKLSASGASDIKISVHADEVYANSSGASDIHIGGYAAFAEVKASGSSDFRGSDFECAVAVVKLSGSSDMRATITDRVNGQLSGSSDLHIHGNPEVNVQTSGSSDVRKVNR
ncbi:MAG: head GIN domain-containing protein [Bacteroidales bacterium]